MEIIFELIFGFLAEFFLSIFGEILVEWGLHSLDERLSSKAWNRIFIGVLYTIGGFVLGAISLQFLPVMIFGSRSIPILYFVFSPIVAGFGLCFANWIVNRGIDDRAGFFQLSKFIYGVVFALTFTVTRSMFG